MISFRKRFIYVHIYKAAGTSVKRALHKYSLDHSRREQLRFFLRSGFSEASKIGWQCIQLGEHAKIREYGRILGQDLSTFFSFTFVRNPYDWEVSHYNFIKTTPEHHQFKEVSPMEFDEYIDWRCSGNRVLQKSFVCDESGKQIVDFIGRFENLDNDFSLVCSHLGIDTKLPHLNRHSHPAAESLFSDRLAARYRAAFEEDFRFFGYSTRIDARRR